MSTLSGPAAVPDRLSEAEVRAVARTLERVYREGRRQLFEHEVYEIVQRIGAISPPRHVFVPFGETLPDEELARFPGERIVLKIVSPDIVHKTEASGIAFVAKDAATVRKEIERLTGCRAEGADVRGVLVVELVERVRPGFGNELFVGIRATREFGPVIAAGLGGIDTEYLADRMRPGLAVAKAIALDTGAEEFLALFAKTAAYDIMSGRARGRTRIVSDAELLRCFRAFLQLARSFCVNRGEEGPDVAELEVNPFAFRDQRLVPLDGRGRLRPAARALPPRPTARIERTLTPRSIAVLGVSSRPDTFGRIILRNLLACGFPRESLHVVKPGTDSIDGVPCVPSVSALPGETDVLVIAAAASQLPDLAREVAECGRVHAAIAISGGVGETEGTGDIAEALRAEILRGRERPDGGPVFLGPNSMGAWSRPGCYDTLFIPGDRFDKRWSAPPRRAAVVSQSGAFILSRMSSLEALDPAFVFSLGNQLDVTASDMLAVLGRRDDLDAIGIYTEGFNDLDGLEMMRNISAVTRAGKRVVFYKAGRTEPGRTAAAGHTASVAGDYDVCQAAAAQAGALVADTFKEFEQMLELCTALHGKKVGGVRIGAVSNAGFETVGMADAIRGQRYRVEITSLSDESRAKLVAVLRDAGLKELVNARNPLDLTPMADEDAYEAAVRVLLDCPEVDALVVGVVPFTARLQTMDAGLESAGSLAHRLPRLFAGATKPLVVVVDAGSRYEPLARALRLGGVPVFPAADQAVRSLGRYLCHRAEAG